MSLPLSSVIYLDTAGRRKGLHCHPTSDGPPHPRLNPAHLVVAAVKQALDESVVFGAAGQRDDEVAGTCRRVNGGPLIPGAEQFAQSAPDNVAAVADAPSVVWSAIMRSNVGYGMTSAVSVSANTCHDVRVRKLTSEHAARQDRRHAAGSGARSTARS